MPNNPRRLAFAVSFLALASCQGAPIGTALRPPPRNLVLIVVDTLRQDRNSCYGCPRATTPNLDALAAHGTQFENAYTVSPWTLPSMTSIVTGLYPSRHGVTAFRESIPDAATTLGEILHENGFATAGVVSNVLVKREYGFARGFDRWDESQALGHRNVSTGPVTDFAGDYLRRMAADGGRFCLYVHYFDPHYAYQRHPVYGFSSDGAGRLQGGEKIQRLRELLPDMTAEEVGFLRDCYDEEVAWTDRGIGRLLRQLDELGLSDDTLVAFVADHGEEFLEHGWIGHTNSLYDELMRVPLVIRDPGWGAHVERRPTSLTGFTPTLLELLGVKADVPFQGESFAAGVRGETPTWNDELFLEVEFHPDSDKNDDKEATFQALVRDDWKLVRDTTTGAFQLFNLASDPRERINQAEEEPERVHKMSDELAVRAAEVAVGAMTPDTLQVADEKRDQLRALGYVGN